VLAARPSEDPNVRVALVEAGGVMMRPKFLCLPPSPSCSKPNTIGILRASRGREINGGLHFLSNYSRGERWGSGSVNFTFDDEGRVAVIVASIDPPSMAGKSIDFIWNADRLPEGCSDFPSIHMHRCDRL
jgi:hypothetical protein